MKVKTVYVVGTSKTAINTQLKTKKIPVIEYTKTGIIFTKPVERHSLLNEYESGTIVKMYKQLDKQNMPIVEAFGTYIKEKNIVI